MKTINFDPLKLEKGSDRFWFWYNEDAAHDIDEWVEISLSYNGSDYFLAYSDESMNIEVYRGSIPTREFFELLLKNCEGIKDFKLIGKYPFATRTN
jgi:hypothetical protein